MLAFQANMRVLLQMFVSILLLTFAACAQDLGSRMEGEAALVIARAWTATSRVILRDTLGKKAPSVQPSSRPSSAPSTTPSTASSASPRAAQPSSSPSCAPTSATAEGDCPSANNKYCSCLRRLGRSLPLRVRLPLTWSSPARAHLSAPSTTPRDCSSGNNDCISCYDLED
jgi:hypothetical protein